MINMLTEIRLNRDNDKRKRWFQNDYFDLFTWQDNSGNITSFQLCYDRLWNEHVICWDCKNGFEHFRVDDGEVSPCKNMSPIFIKEGIFPYHEVMSQFVQSSQQINEDIRVFIIQKMDEYVQDKSWTPCQFFYLHGWASSPQSDKAQFFKQCLEQRGLKLHIPDLNQNDFYHLTLTRQIQQVEALLPDSPVTIIGSSLGGLIALWLAERQAQIESVVVLAPALNFLRLCEARMGETQFAQWRSQGEFAFEHYAEKRERLVSYGFIEDMLQYVDADLQRRVPTLILHGKQDEVVSIQTSRDFAATRPWVELVEFESDHRLNDVQAQLWQAIQTFCQLVDH